MCGISGIVSENVARHRKAQDAMVQSMYHRGPDENAVHFFENCSLGHNRLSIVDITTRKQPMLTEDAQVGIVFNGEIYGYKEIRRHVHYEYKTESDTELILALYSQHGTGLVNYLPGMFSFAIWDDNKHQLFVSRDRFGEKPFYYAITTDGDFVFASEIKAILASGLTKQSINPTAVSRFLNHGYIGPDLTIYNNIKALPPAHSLVFKDGKVVEATSNNTKRLNEILDTDAGARYVGEFSLGFNPYILTPMCDILFDEKIAGSLHFTPGQAYEDCDNGNRSAVHWDMVLIQRKEWGGGEIWFDGELIRKDGIFLPRDLKPLNPQNLK